MSSVGRDERLIELVAAFTDMGPAWTRWVQACIPDDTVSYARLRALNALECHPEGLTMTRLAEALEVTGRRVTALMLLHNKKGQVVARAQASFTVIQRRRRWWQLGRRDPG